MNPLATLPTLPSSIDPAAKPAPLRAVAARLFISPQAPLHMPGCVFLPGQRSLPCGALLATRQTSRLGGPLGRPFIAAIEAGEILVPKELVPMLGEKPVEALSPHVLAVHP
jgi:hypothetical protein